MIIDINDIMRPKGDKSVVPSYSAVPANHPALFELTKVMEWLEAGKFVLEKNECSRLHLLTEALLSKRCLRYGGTDKIWVTHTSRADDPILHVKHTFVMRHDWAGAFEGAVGIADNCRLPFEMCAFEFRISGHTVIAVSFGEEVAKSYFIPFVQSGDYWVALELNDVPDTLVEFLQIQICASCVALDAEVATHSVVRAPAKLNEKRVSKGHRPLSDYYVVDLAKRHRVANPSTEVGGGGKKRLHFRRGHWRHYEETKTWVKWCLVGNPDLGFVNKHYSL